MRKFDDAKYIAEIGGIDKLSSSNLDEALRKLEVRDHLCLIYESPEEWRSTVIPFLKIGLERGERCIYIADSNSTEKISTFLRQEKVRVNNFQKSGQLIVIHQEEIFAKKGHFDSNQMLSFLATQAKQALASGYSALRITNEMEWVLHNNMDPDQLIRYEAKLNRDFFSVYPCVDICQYDRQKFSTDIIKAAIMTHPLVVWRNHIYRNFYYLPPEKFFSQKRSEYEVENWLNNLDREYKKERQLAYMATHDPLTDLPNRLLFNDRLSLELAHAQRNRERLALMLLDLDNFKLINDKLGHKVGDKFLRTTAARLKSILRRSDTIARMGGDEFLLILSALDREGDVIKAADKIMDTFKEPFIAEDHKFHLTTSIGFAIYPDDTDDIDGLVKYADIAMYCAKKKGRNNYQRYNSSMHS